jgi:ABC-type Fe3+ transport system substrate-binding protein
VKRAEARVFIDFLASPAVQQAIADFRREAFGEPLFFPAVASAPAAKPEAPIPAPAGTADSPSRRVR